MVTFIGQCIRDLWKEVTQSSEAVQAIFQGVESSAVFKAFKEYVTVKTVRDDRPINVAAGPGQPSEREQKVKDWLQNASNLATVHFCNSSLSSLAMGFVANRIVNLEIARWFDPKPQTVQINPGDQGFGQAKVALQKMFERQRWEHVSNLGTGALAVLMNQLGLWNQSPYLAFGGPLVCAAINKVAHFAIGRRIQ